MRVLRALGAIGVAIGLEACDAPDNTPTTSPASERRETVPRPVPMTEMQITKARTGVAALSDAFPITVGERMVVSGSPGGDMVIEAWAMEAGRDLATTCLSDGVAVFTRGVYARSLLHGQSEAGEYAGSGRVRFRPDYFARHAERVGLDSYVAGEEAMLTFRNPDPAAARTQTYSAFAHYADERCRCEGLELETPLEVMANSSVGADALRFGPNWYLYTCHDAQDPATVTNAIVRPAVSTPFAG